MKTVESRRMLRVRVGSRYIYDPVILDQIDKPYGVQQGILKVGDVVKVINLPGCPKANIMGHCYVQTESGEFAGMVRTLSLIKRS